MRRLAPVFPGSPPGRSRAVLVAIVLTIIASLAAIAALLPWALEALVEAGVRDRMLDDLHPAPQEPRER